jgi:hypothetical protein
MFTAIRVSHANGNCAKVSIASRKIQRQVASSQRSVGSVEATKHRRQITD